MLKIARSVERTVTVLCIVVSCSLFNAALVRGDYLFSFSLTEFSQTANRLANGSCCVPSQNPLICTTQCKVKLLYCFRPPHYPLTAGNCPLLAVASEVTNAGRTLAIQGPWMGGIQLMMKAEHIGADLLDNNQLIDRVFFELSLLVQDSPRTVFSVGEAGYVSARVSDVSVACEGSFCGSNCNLMGRDDSTGHFTCRGNDIVCIHGYQYPANNCTDCVPAPGCSPIGGFCSLPFECKCRDSFTGDRCDQEKGDDSISVTTTSTETASHSSVDAILPTSSTATTGTTTTDTSTKTTTTTTGTSSGTSTTSTASITAPGDTSSSTRSSSSDTNTHTPTSGTASSGEGVVTSMALDQVKHSVSASPSSTDSGALSTNSSSGSSHSTTLLIAVSVSGPLLCLIVICIVLVVTIFCCKRIRRRGKYSVKIGSPIIRLLDINKKDPVLLSSLTPTNQECNQQPQLNFEDLVVTNPTARDNVDYSSIQHPSPSPTPLQTHTLRQPLNYAALDHSEAARLRRMFNPFSSTSECPP